MYNTLCTATAALEGVQEGLESLSVYVTGIDALGSDNVSQRSDHHNTSSTEVVRQHCKNLSHINCCSIVLM